MICCDHCEEWFHGMCVGITMAQGRQMEKDGQEYICPKCQGESRPTMLISAWVKLYKGITGKYCSVHVAGHTVGFHPQTQKLEPPCTA